MIRLLCCLGCLLFADIVSAQSNLAVHLVERHRMAVDGSGATYLDTYSDGTTKKEVVPWPAAPTAVHLVATNDAGQAWRLDYAATYNAGGNVSVRTNSTFHLKPREERLMPKRPPMLPPPDPRPWTDRATDDATNQPSNAFAQIAARHAAMYPDAVTTCRMSRVPRVQLQNIVGSNLVSLLSDGTTVTQQIQRMVTARVTTPSPAQPSSGLPTGTVAAALAAAFAGGVVAGKFTGAKSNPIDPAPSGAGTPTT